MKRNKPMITFIAILTAGATFASAFTVREFKEAPAARLNMPVLPDSLQKENSFSNDRLLSSRLPLTLEQFKQDWTTILPDSTGRIKTEKATERPELHTYTTTLRPKRYVKGKLMLNSNAMAEVLADGKSVIKKTESDSLPTDASSPFEMNPETDYRIQINLVSLPTDKAAPDFMLEFVPDEKFNDVEILASSDMKRRFAVKTTTDGLRCSKVDISPDGKYMIVKYTEVYDAEHSTKYAELCETSTGRVITTDLPDGAKWLPKGSSIYYTVNRNERFDVYRMEIPSMKSGILARALPDNSFSFTPDQKYIIYYDNVKGAADQGPLKRVKGPDDRIPGNRDRSYIVRYDIANGFSEYLTYAGATTYITDFSRDGRKMLYTSSVNVPSEYPFYFTDVIEMDLQTLKTDTLIHRDPALTGAIYSPDARKLFVTGGPSSFYGIGMNADYHEIPNDFDIQGFIFDIATREATAVTKDFAPSINSSSAIWNPKDNMIYFRAVEGFNTPVYSLSPSDGKLTRLPLKVETVTSFTIGDDEDKWLGYVGQSFTNVGTAYLCNLRNGESRLIADPMKDYMSEIALGDMKPWVFTASDGTVIDGMVCLPPDFDPTKKYPLIVYYYGGTTPCNSSMHHPYTPQLFASRDYVVYVVNPSGTIGYGQEFSARHVNAWGKRTAEDIIEGVKEFCSDHPFVDEEKIGCLGASYGGFMTQYLQTLTDIFAAAVSHAGISNVTSYWGEGFWGYSYNAVAAAQSYPWSDPELFTQQGSLFNADRIHTPLLLLHGTDDTNVPIGESIQLFNALRILGRDVEFITVQDQNHIITDYDKKQIWQNTIMAWFAKYLQDDPRWWDSMYGD